MKTMIRRMLPLGLLLVFAVYGYTQDKAAVTVTKETKSTNCSSSCPKFVDKNGDGICDIKKDCSDCKGKTDCSGKDMQDCKKSCSGGHGKAACGASSPGCSPAKGSGNQATSPDKTTVPKK